MVRCYWNCEQQSLCGMMVHCQHTNCWGPKNQQSLCHPMVRCQLSGPEKQQPLYYDLQAIWALRCSSLSAMTLAAHVPEHMT